MPEPGGSTNEREARDKAVPFGCCPDHGIRDQDGCFIRHGQRCCNQTIRKENGIPILCGKPVAIEPERKQFADAKRKEFAGATLSSRAHAAAIIWLMKDGKERTEAEITEAVDRMPLEDLVVAIPAILEADSLVPEDEQIGLW